MLYNAIYHGSWPFSCTMMLNPHINSHKHFSYRPSNRVPPFQGVLSIGLLVAALGATAVGLHAAQQRGVAGGVRLHMRGAHCRVTEGPESHSERGERRQECQPRGAQGQWCVKCTMVLDVSYFFVHLSTTSLLDALLHNNLVHLATLNCRASWCWCGWMCWRPLTTATRSSGKFITQRFCAVQYCLMFF